tara:strand:- start:426 stop:1286 length:861 start_codon:yes stop_codon:yes gene_type:complete
MSGIVGTNAGRASGVVGTIDSSVAADAITGDELADNAVDSEHYTDGSIDNAHIADDAIDSEHYAAGSIDTAHIADNQITLAKMAGGTDGNIISYDASGDPVAIATGSDGQVLTSTGAGSPPAFEAAAAGGKVLQCVSLTKVDTFSTTSSSSFVDTGLEIAITPASGTKCLVMVDFNYGVAEGKEGTGRLTRGTTAIAIATAASSRPVGSFNLNFFVAYSDGGLHTKEAGLTTLDTHGADGSTAVTYKLQYQATGSSALYMNRTVGDDDGIAGGRAVSSITVLEIGS